MGDGGGLLGDWAELGSRWGSREGVLCVWQRLCSVCFVSQLKRSEGVGDVESRAAVETRQGGCEERDLLPPRTLVFSSSPYFPFVVPLTPIPVLPASFFPVCAAFPFCIFTCLILKHFAICQELNEVIADLIFKLVSLSIKSEKNHNWVIYHAVFVSYSPRTYL